MKSVRIQHNTQERVRQQTQHEVTTVRARQRKPRQLILLTLLTLAVSVAAGFKHNFIPSASMEPNLRPGDHILTMREWLAYPFGAMPSRGDIIVFRMPDAENGDEADAPANGEVGAATRSNDTEQADEEAQENQQSLPFHLGGSKSEVLIKRVVGLPGDLVQLKNNQLLINGQPVQEDYKLLPADTSVGYAYPYAVYEPLRVPPGHLFVLGDNRDNSDDGRYWGTLPRKNVLGRFVRVLYHEGNLDLPEPTVSTRRD